MICTTEVARIESGMTFKARRGHVVRDRHNPNGNRQIPLDVLYAKAQAELFLELDRYLATTTLGMPGTPASLALLSRLRAEAGY